MANTYYDSELTAEEIEEVLETINGILTQANNGKVLAINNGKIEARSVQWGGSVIQPLSVSQNGTYTAPAGVDGYSPIQVAVPSAGGGFSGEEVYDLLLSQGARWIDTEYDVSNVNGFVFFEHDNQGELTERFSYIKKSDIPVKTGAADVYVRVCSVNSVDLNVRIENNTLRVSFRSASSLAPNTGALIYTEGNLIPFVFYPFN